MINQNKNNLKDLQNSYDIRNEDIQKVGIKNLKYPVKIINNNKIYSTIGSFSISVSLMSKKRGIHMSRFLEILNEQELVISCKKVMKLTEIIKSRLNSENAFLKVKYPYFIKKVSPISKKKSFLEYNICYDCKSVNKNKTCNIKIKIPITTSCPCSKIISKYGAHNQRSIITIILEIKEDINIETEYAYQTGKF